VNQQNQKKNRQNQKEKRLRERGEKNQKRKNQKRKNQKRKNQKRRRKRRNLCHPQNPLSVIVTTSGRDSVTYSNRTPFLFRRSHKQGESSFEPRSAGFQNIVYFIIKAVQWIPLIGLIIWM
jgi:hypothetical protein